MTEFTLGTSPPGPPDPADPLPPFPSDQEPLPDPKAPVPTESIVGEEGGGGGAPPEYPAIPGGGAGTCPLGCPIGDETIENIF